MKTERTFDDGQDIVRGLAYVILFAALLVFDASCGMKIKPLPQKPNLEPVKVATTQAVTAAKATQTSAKQLSDVFDQHKTDERPTKVFVAETTPLVHTVLDNATLTVLATQNIQPTVVVVEKQVQVYSQAAETQTEQLVATTQALEKEKTSWFGGRIGRLLWWTLFWGCVVGVLWAISKLVLMFGPASVVSEILTPIHIVANLLEVAISGVVNAFKLAWQAIEYVWNEWILKHIPWPEASPVASTGVKTNV